MTRLLASASLPIVFRLLLFAFCLLLSAFRLLPSAFRLPPFTSLGYLSPELPRASAVPARPLDV